MKKFLRRLLLILGDLSTNRYSRDISIGRQVLEHLAQANLFYLSLPFHTNLLFLKTLINFLSVFNSFYINFIEKELQIAFKNFWLRPCSAFETPLNRIKIIIQKHFQNYEYFREEKKTLNKSINEQKKKNKCPKYLISLMLLARRVHVTI